MITGFILVLAMIGQPERVIDALDTMAQCNAAGTRVVSNYSRIYNLQPRDISYRCIPVGK